MGKKWHFLTKTLGHLYIFTSLRRTYWKKFDTPTPIPNFFSLTFTLPHDFWPSSCTYGLFCFVLLKDDSILWNKKWKKNVAPIDSDFIDDQQDEDRSVDWCQKKIGPRILIGLEMPRRYFFAKDLNFNRFKREDFELHY